MSRLIFRSLCDDTGGLTAPARRRFIAPLATNGVAAIVTALAGGCISWTPAVYTPPDPIVEPPLYIQRNPLLVPVMDRDLVWEHVVDVVDDFFPKFEREDRVRQVGDVLTEGRIDTFPVGGATLLEPWRGDSATPYERLESTLQSTRRKAEIHVIPDEAGFLIDVAVYKELEDVARPEDGLVSAAPLRHDSSLRRYNSPVGGDRFALGWIPAGRDVALEQLIISRLQTRLGGITQPRAF